MIGPLLNVWGSFLLHITVRIQSSADHTFCVVYKEATEKTCQVKLIVVGLLYFCRLFILIGTLVINTLVSLTLFTYHYVCCEICDLSECLTNRDHRKVFPP